MVVKILKGPCKTSICSGQFRGWTSMNMSWLVDTYESWGGSMLFLKQSLSEKLGKSDFK
jgi:hypothetical protein